MFKVGQKVVCVDNVPFPGRVWQGDKPAVGAIYTIRAVGIKTNIPPAKGRTGILLEEIRNSFPFLRIDRGDSVVCYALTNVVKCIYF